MLDDLKMIHARDAQDALGVAEKQGAQLVHEFQVADIKGDFQNIVLAGMGGSALSGMLGATWPGYTLPFEICRDYDIPHYIGPNTLFIAYSFSGNTEEALSALSQAEKTGAVIAIVASGGKLADIARTQGYPLALLPQLSQPRYGALSGLRAITEILVAANSLDREVLARFTRLQQFADETVRTWRPDVRTKDNYAKQIALDIVGSSIVVYAGVKLFPAAYKWKINFNENAKNVAWCSQLPEFCHNELLGWSSHPVDKPYKIIDLQSSLEHPRIIKRFEVADRLLSGRRPAAMTINAQGSDIAEHMLWTVILGDFVSLYLAMLNGLNPTPVDLVEKFKKELG